MASLNKVLLIGNLTRDPQLSYLPSQTAVVEFGLAMNRKWTSKEGQKREEVCFVDCQAYGRPAETINKYLSKGKSVFVEGRLKFDTWTAQDGSKRSKHRVVVENFQFLGGQQGQGQDHGYTQDAQAPAAQRSEPDSVAGDIPNANDDIPF